MNNFKAKRYKDGKRIRYVHYSGEEGRVMKLTISHRDGGMNYFSSRTEKRGIEIGITEVELSRMGDHVMESSTPMDEVNGRLLVLELPRYSASKVEAVTRQFDAHAPEIARLWRQDNEAARTLLFATAEDAARTV